VSLEREKSDLYVLFLCKSESRAEDNIKTEFRGMGFDGLDFKICLLRCDTV
jgi:hypothetical protein